MVHKYMSDRLKDGRRDLRRLSYVTPDLVSLFCFDLLL